MSRADGVLRVVLTGRWFDMIESGEKLEEYRKDKASTFEYYGDERIYTDYLTWSDKLFADHAWLDCEGEPMPRCRYVADRIAIESDRNTWHPYHTLVASRGYTARTLTRKIRRIRWGTPRPEWSGDTVTGECFVIELDNETDQAILPV